MRALFIGKVRNRMQKKQDCPIFNILLIAGCIKNASRKERLFYKSKAFACSADFSIQAAPKIVTNGKQLFSFAGQQAAKRRFYYSLRVETVRSAENIVALKKKRAVFVCFFPEGGRLVKHGFFIFFGRAFFICRHGAFLPA